MFPTQFSYLIGYDIPFFHITVSLKNANRFATFFFREYFFPNLTFILFDQTVGSTDDGLRRTIILLQFKDFRVRINLREIKDIINIRSTERVNTLRIIAYHTNTLIFFRQLKYNAMLGIIRILILVHQHITELLPITGQHFRKVAEQNIRIHQQIIEIHSSRLTASFPVTGIYFTDSRHFGCHISFIRFFVGGISRRRNQMVFGTRNAGLHHPRLICLFVQSHLLDDGTDQTFTIRRIINGKLGSESDILCFGTENAGKDGMEGTHPQITCPLHAHLTGYTFFHLTRRLIGKGQCEDVPRLIAVFQQIGNFISQHTCLSRTCTGYHQRRPVVISHCCTLTLI